MATKRGRQSAGDLSVVRLSSARMPAPDWLNESESIEWRGIVDSLPADYFRPADGPLLAAYCVAAALHKDARAEITRDGTSVEDDRGRRQMNPAVTVLQYQAGTMAQLSVKLRLAPSSRYTEKTAATKAGSLPKPAARPWEEAQPG